MHEATSPLLHTYNWLREDFIIGWPTEKKKKEIDRMHPDT